MVMEPTEEQYLVLNALDTLGLLITYFFDDGTGCYYLRTVSRILPISKLLADGEITSIELGES